MQIREQIEQIEAERLAPWAARARISSGRLVPESDHAYRTCFQRDRDRVLHSTAFRRLQYKTQVFVQHEGDHFRNRLTHTLEVAQIARTIARALGANEDLTEAIVLAHDLGHTPFGHAGERALHPLLERFGGFEHNRQSLRLVDWIERRAPGFRGLNLTLETRAGILKHGSRYPRHSHPVPLPPLGASPTAEAQIANLADSIAYGAHDIDDGLRSGLLDIEGLEQIEAWTLARRARGLVAPVEREACRPVIVGLIDLLVTDLVEASSERLRAGGFESSEALCAAAEPQIRPSEQGRRLAAEVRDHLRASLYAHPQVIEKGLEGARILGELWVAYTEDPARVPATLRGAPDEPPERAIADYLAGMTDRFALEEHRKLHGGPPSAPGLFAR